MPNAALTGFQVVPNAPHGIIHDFKLSEYPESCAMGVAVRTDREGERATIVLSGALDLAHATAVAKGVESAETCLGGCHSVDVDLSQLDRIDGAGAVLLARLLDRLDADKRRARVVEGCNTNAARLIALYRERREDRSAPQRSAIGSLDRIGASAAQLPGKANEALEFIGRYAAALPKATAKPNSIDWGSLPRLMQDIGAQALPVTSAANLLVGVIVGLLGVSQLGRFGAVSYVPELVVVAHFRELGPLVTAIVVAGRSGAGLASEIATMKVSEEIDALRSMGFDPLRWLVVPRCLALAATVPLLTWVGDAVALIGGMGATLFMTQMTAHAYIQATLYAITPDHLVAGLVKSPFLGFAIGLIACCQGLLALGGAAAVGARTTTAVVLAIFGVIVISAVFTFFLALIGV